MANDYQKKHYRFTMQAGLVLAAQPEGIADDAFPRLHNTKIYREGAIGLRDQREFFMGVESLQGIPGWITGITRLDNEFLFAFRGTSLYGFQRVVPGTGRAPSGVALPKTGRVVSFENFLPASGIATFATVHPDERANPTMYFTKPGTTRMWKAYRHATVARRDSATAPATTQGMSSADAVSFAQGSDIEAAVSQVGAVGRVALVVTYWGLNAPTGRPTASVYNDPAGKLRTNVAGGQRYDWVWCHRNSVTSSLSNPSAGLAATLAVQAPAVNAVHLELPVDTGGDAQIDSIRIYRKGGVLTDYHKVADVYLHRQSGEGGYGPQTIKFDDTKGDNDIKDNEILRLDSFVPFISTSTTGEAIWNAVCSYVFGPFNPGNVILGIGEKSKPGSVFWTNPGRPDTTNGTNNVDVTSSGDPLLCGCVYNGLPYVASRGDWYALDPQRLSGLVELTFLPRKTKVGRGPVAPWATCVGDYIFFVNTEGVWATDGQTAAMSLSQALDPIFHGEQVGEYKAIKWDSPQEMFRVFWAAPQLHFIYPDTDGVMRHLVYDGQKWMSEDFARGRYSHSKLTPTPPGGTIPEPWDQPEPYLHTTCVFNDVAWPERNLLLGTDRGAVFLSRPYVTSGWEVSDYVWDGSTADAEVQSWYGWVLGHYRTRTDDMDQPSRLKQIGDVSWEASGKWDPGYDGKHKVTAFVTAESGQHLIGSTARLIGSVPIGSTVVNTAVTGRARYVFPLDANEEVYSTAWDFLFYGKWNFHNLTMFFTPRTEVIKHYQNTNTNHGIDGWQHVRDGYLDLTLYGPANLVLEVDQPNNIGPVVFRSDKKKQLITITPSITRGDGSVQDLTGQRFKYYISFLPMKGKKFTWYLDCANGMMIWAEGCEVNGKKWITATGYGNVNPLADPSRQQG